MIQPPWRTAWRFLKKTKIELPYDPAVTTITRKEKTRDLFKKIRYTKGTFHAKMGTIKDRNGRDLTEAEDIKRRWQEEQKSS